MTTNEILREIREWGFFILALATLIIGISTLIFQYHSTQTIEPNIHIRLTDDAYSFPSYNLASIYHTVNGTFWMNEGYLNFQINNLGLKSTNYINLYVKDVAGEYQFGNVQLKNLGSLQDDFFQIPFWSKSCGDIYRGAQYYNQSWNIPAINCSKVGDKLVTGIKDLLLKVDCPGCDFGADTKCYSFKICIYNSTSAWCEDNWKKDYYNLNVIDCPKNWTTI
jgi:hypothetical protein